MSSLEATVEQLDPEHMSRPRLCCNVRIQYSLIHVKTLRNRSNRYFKDKVRQGNRKELVFESKKIFLLSGRVNGPLLSPTFTNETSSRTTCRPMCFEHSQKTWCLGYTRRPSLARLAEVVRNSVNPDRH